MSAAGTLCERVAERRQDFRGKGRMLLRSVRHSVDFAIQELMLDLALLLERDVFGVGVPVMWSSREHRAQR